MPVRDTVSVLIVVASSCLHTPNQLVFIVYQVRVIIINRVIGINIMS